MFSVEASTTLPFPPHQVFMLACDRESLPRWCGILRLDGTRTWTIDVADTSTVLRPLTVSIDTEQRTVIHEALGEGLIIRWELTVDEHFDGASFRVRTFIDFAPAYPHRVAICRTTSREASDDLARIAGLLEGAYTVTDRT